MKLSVVIPVYNEEETVLKVIEELQVSLGKIKKSYEIIVVNDGSNDNTVKFLKDMKGIVLIQHPYNKGYGSALKSGIRIAKGDLICIIDADCSYPTTAIPKLLERMGQYDMVVGARINKTSEKEHRKLTKWLLAKLASYLSGTKIPDLNSGMRIFKKEDAIKFFHILPSGFSFTTTITLAYLSNDYTVNYVPIDYYKRGGTSKINPIKDGLNFLFLIIRTISYFNPLKIFIPLSFFLILLGAAIIVIIQIISVFGKNIPLSGMLLIITGIQFLILGIIADLIAKKDIGKYGK